MFRAAIAAGTRARPRRSSRSSTRGELVPDELMIALIRERLAAGRRARRASSSTASRARSRRPRRSTRCSREIGRDARRRASCSRSPTRSRRERLRGARAEEGRADDTPEAIAEPARDSTTSETEPRGRALPHARQPSSPIHAERTVDEVFARDPGRARAGRGEPMIIRKCAARDRADRARRARSSPRRSRTSASTLEPGRHDRASSTRIAERVHPRARRRPDLQGLPRLPGGDLHLAERRWSSTGSRAPYRRRGRRPRHDRRRRHARRLRRRQRVHVRRRRDRRRGAAAARRRARTALAAGIAAGARRATGSATSRTRPGGRRGGRLLGRPQPRRARRRPLTTTRTRRSRTSASRAAGRGSPRG